MDNPIYRREWRVNEGRLVDVPLFPDEIAAISARIEQEQAEEVVRKERKQKEDRLKARALSAASILEADAPTTLDEAIQHIEACKVLLKWLYTSVRQLEIQPDLN